VITDSTRASDAEPLPGNVYVVAAQVANSPERRPARIRVQAADRRQDLAAVLTGRSPGGDRA
jgi:hypothetical protein